jgi:ATP-dependent phosphofructokinase / diphosphate-dependent phosphofructokinase
MAQTIRRIAVSTGGGDAPGLNAVIRAVVLAGLRRGWEIVGIRRGFGGLLDDDGLTALNADSVRGITHLGGTILGTTNRGNPFDWPVQAADGTVHTVDRSDEVLEAVRRHGIDAMIIIGGDGTLHIAQRLADKGLAVIGVPKTIDNDLAATITFGFHTAVQTATEAVDKLHSTAESHERVFVVEVMGWHTGWIALRSGIASTADVILIPEIPYDLDKVCAKIRSRYDAGRRFAIVVAAEGAAPRGGEASHVEQAGAGRAARLGGIAERLAAEIAERTGHETRSLVLGHLQRGGTPVAYDRFIALRAGAAAVQFAEEGRFGTMVAIHDDRISPVPLRDAVDSIKYVDPASDAVLTAKATGISFGD